MKQLGTTPAGNIILEMTPGQHQAIGKMSSLLGRLNGTVAECVQLQASIAPAPPPPPAPPKRSAPARRRPSKPRPKPGAHPKAATKPKPSNAGKKQAHKPPIARKGTIPWSKIFIEVIQAAGRPLTVQEVYDAIKDRPDLAAVQNLKYRIGVNLASTHRFQRVAPATYAIKGQASSGSSDLIMTANPEDLTIEQLQERLKRLHRVGREDTAARKTMLEKINRRH